MKRILLAEDNDDLRELIEDYLSENGFEICAKIMDLHGMKYGAVNSRYGVEFYINM